MFQKYDTLVKPGKWYLVKFRAQPKEPLVYKRALDTRKEWEEVAKNKGIKIGTNLVIMKGSQAIEYGLSRIHDNSRVYRAEFKGLIGSSKYVHSALDDDKKSRYKARKELRKLKKKRKR